MSEHLTRIHHRMCGTWRYVLGRHLILGFSQFIGFVIIVTILKEHETQTPISILGSIVFAILVFGGAAPDAASHAFRRTPHGERRHRASYASYALQGAICATFLAFIFREDFFSSSLSSIPYLGILLCLIPVSILVHAIVPASVYQKLNG